MSATLESLGIHKLSLDERLDLLGELWNNISHDSESRNRSIGPELAAELDRRIADLDENPDDSIPWETVRDEALARLSK